MDWKQGRITQQCSQKLVLKRRNKIISSGDGLLFKALKLIVTQSMSKEMRRMTQTIKGFAQINLHHGCHLSFIHCPEYVVTDKDA